MSFTSIIIPAYNHQAFICDTISSAIEQTLKSFEVIIVDDGSTDACGRICRQFADNHEYIRYVYQENQGTHSALNNGIKLAHSDYIAVLNSDDLFYPHKIQRCLEIIKQNPGVEIVAGDVTFIDEKSRVQERGTAIKWQKRAYEFFDCCRNPLLSLLNENFVATTSNLFFTKNVWEKVGGFQPLRYCNDLDFITAGMRHADFYFDRAVPHVRYRLHRENTISEEYAKVQIEIAAVIAVALVDDNSALLGDTPASVFPALGEFLKNKGLSNLIISMMMLYSKVRSRTIFYASLQEGPLRQSLMHILKG